VAEVLIMGNASRCKGIKTWGVPATKASDIEANISGNNNLNKQNLEAFLIYYSRSRCWYLSVFGSSLLKFLSTLELKAVKAWTADLPAVDPSNP
jgi:hypothetical protein